MLVSLSGVKGLKHQSLDDLYFTLSRVLLKMVS